MERTYKIEVTIKADPALWANWEMEKTVSGVLHRATEKHEFEVADVELLDWTDTKETT